MTDQYELGRLRRAAIDPFDRKILTLLMQMGGEFGYCPGNLTKEELDRVIAGLGSLADRNLIMVDEARSTLSRWVLRLTDNGRQVCAQLEALAAKPPVEVQMHGDVPEVVKPLVEGQGRQES
jgi:hypothetical protein